MVGMFGGNVPSATGRIFWIRLRSCNVRAGCNDVWRHVGGAQDHHGSPVRRRVWRLRRVYLSSHRDCAGGAHSGSIHPTVDLAVPSGSAWVPP